jgi:hypothetical protein
LRLKPAPSEVGAFIHPCELSEMLCKSTQDKIPYFNAPVYLENKQKIGKIEEVLGPVNEVVRASCSSLLSAHCGRAVPCIGTPADVPCVIRGSSLTTFHSDRVRAACLLAVFVFSTSL